MGDIYVEDEKILVSKKKYEELLADRRWLLALEDAGVDNWSGYDFAIEILNGEVE